MVALDDFTSEEPLSDPSRRGAATPHLQTRSRGHAPRSPSTASRPRSPPSGALKPRRVRGEQRAPRSSSAIRPAILIPIDGKPCAAHSRDAFERVLNTRAPILRELGTLFLHVYDGWLTASAVNGPGRSRRASRRDRQRRRRPGEQGAAGSARRRQRTAAASLANGAPAIYVSLKPAELIVFKGPTTFRRSARPPVVGHEHHLRRDLRHGDNAYYVLLAGRWYRRRR